MRQDTERPDAVVTDPQGPDPTRAHGPDGVEGNPVVVARGLAASYRGVSLWRDAAFRITRGEFGAVLGPNGAGKSTLLRLLLGLLRPAAGSLQVLGAPPRRGSPFIGNLPQARSIDPDIAFRESDLISLGIEGPRWGVGLPSRRRRAARERPESAPRAPSRPWVRASTRAVAGWARCREGSASG